MSPWNRLTRRQSLAPLAAAPFAFLGSAREQASASRPNIVFLMADDLGFADLSCYGRPDYKTPNLDRLATQGLRFLQAYANSAVCTATRVALITGRYQYRVAVGLEEPLASPARNIGLPPSHPTLPSLLKKVGYGTTLIGKWHLGWLPDYGPLKSGYDHFYGFRGGKLDYFTHKSAGPDVAGDTDDLWDQDAKVHEHGYLTELLADRAVATIGGYAKSKQPFLISLHFNAPHWPWEGPDDEAESRRVTANLADYDGGDAATYGRMVVAMDTAIGRVLEALDKNGIANNTIVVFTSDNGGERFSDVWPFSGSKMELLEGGLRIPAIAHWPGHIRVGTSDQVCISMDWVATLLEAAGAKPDPAYPLDGISLIPALTSQAAPVPRKLYWRYRGNAQEAMRSGDMKYFKIRDNEFLFNVVADPLERANLKARQPDVYRRMLAEYRAWDANMLPIDPKAYTESVTGKVRADHYGIDE